MTALKARSRTTRARLPAGLSPTGKLVYLYLAERGSATVSDLKTALGVPQIRLYPAIDALERKNLLERAGDEFAVPR